MCAKNFIIHCAIFPWAVQRVVRAFQPEHGVVGTDKILIPVAIDVHQAAVDASAARLIAGKSQAEIMQGVGFPIWPREKHDLAIKRSDDVNFSVRIPIGCNSGIDHAFCLGNDMFLPFRLGQSGKEWEKK